MVEYLEELEPRRGCGYRYVGKLYIRGTGIARYCDRLPILLTVCPVCGQGIKFSRGWTRLNAEKLFGKHGDMAISCVKCGERLDVEEVDGRYGYYCHNCEILYPSREAHPCVDEKCFVCEPPENVFLLWVGSKFYTPESFVAEAEKLGISKAVPSIPAGFEVGKTVVYLAHKKAFTAYVRDVSTLGGFKELQLPGIFYAFIPTRFEMLVKRTDYEANREKYEKMEKKGITVIVVPDDYDKMVERAERKYRESKRKRR